MPSIEQGEKRRTYNREWYRKNRERLRISRRDWARKNRLKQRDRDLQKEFGLSLEERNRRIVEREGRCDICGQVPRGTLHVDHDHETKENRGMLCVNCNIGVGMFKDNPEFLLEAVNYLKRWGKL